MRVKGCWRGSPQSTRRGWKLYRRILAHPQIVICFSSFRGASQTRWSFPERRNVISFFSTTTIAQHRAAAARYSTRIMSMKARTAGSSNPVCSDEQCLYSSMKIANFALYTQTLRQPSKFHLELETPPLNTRKLKGTGGNIRYVDCIYNSSFELHSQQIYKCFPDKKLNFEYRKLQYKY